MLKDVSYKTTPVEKYIDSSRCESSDAVSVEEPLEIRLAGSSMESSVVAVTMRTPGHDRELAAGFLFTEGIISSFGQIDRVEVEKCNVVNVFVKDNVAIDPAIFNRHSFVASSCGVCGKKSINAVRIKRQFSCLHDSPLLTPDFVHRLPNALKEYQAQFERTGGTHASCIFDINGNVIELMEDVGRHNALDKLLGSTFLSGQLPLTDHVLMVSGRASFELVQKASHAGLPVLIAVGAPSSLAVQLAQDCDMTLLGFVREDRFNVYSGGHWIVTQALRKEEAISMR